MVTAYHSSWTHVEALSPRRASTREMVWSFAGALKTADRPGMLAALRAHPDLQPCTAFDNEGPQAAQRAYLASAFVPIGRGAVVLDCGRIAEAAVCGAIPVIVGPAREIDAAFCEWPGLPTPPWLFFGSWEEAAQGMAALAAQPAALDARQAAVRRWWSTAVAFWRGEIARALDVRCV